MRWLIGTRKGLFRLERNSAGWNLSPPLFAGVPVTVIQRDCRDGAIWVGLAHGHWGAKLHVSRDDLASFEELPCPAFPEGYEVTAVTEFGNRPGPAAVKILYAITPAGEAGTLLVGTDPGGLFATTDGGQSWTVNDSLWKRRNEDPWFEGGGGVMLHSVLVDPHDPRHLHVAVSCGGVYESTDGGESWQPRNKGVRADFLPDKFPEVGQDPHILLRHRGDPDVLWQQNHCGNWRSADQGRSWADITEGLPTTIGFALALDDNDADTAWTIPMDSDEIRIAPDHALAVWRTEDGGNSWQAFRKGLPQEHCYDIVYRHALDIHGDALLFGTTCGRLFASLDRGESWELVAPYLPQINVVKSDPA